MTTLLLSKAVAGLTTHQKDPQSSLKMVTAHYPFIIKDTKENQPRQQMHRSEASKAQARSFCALRTQHSLA
jgi:hypothetical protein